ncbi:MAG: cyclic pyranopterin monophosphate synthase MoaC [Candidatus Thermoplasmatota archaeon]|jgi:cyclic pyranopterin phosphate synthase|nr:cyclic pyranopterin monophosphate synthase MoaC [Candidatus Thermoplasmatota archaeon]
MIDISSKDVVERTATASGEIKLKESTLDTINRKETKKGDVIETARVAGMQAAKRTWDTIPYCHQIPISSVNLEFNTQRDSIKVRCSVKAVYKTGVEMEAISCVQASLLTIWDMVKYLEKDENGQYPETQIRYVKVDRKEKVALDASFDR